MKSTVLAIIVALVTSCARSPEASTHVSMAVSADGAGFFLRLVPAAGARINAKLAPTLELVDGGRISFTIGAVDADSAYFVEPPTARIGSDGQTLDGTLRVGICPAGLNVCQSLELPVAASVITAP